MGYICMICRESLKSHNFELNEKLKKTKEARTTLKINGKLGDCIVATKCGHMFHHTCLSTWLSSCYENLKCPTCNGLIYTYELIQLFPSDDGEDSKNDHSSRPCKELRPFSELKKIQEVLLLAQHLLKDLEQRDQIASQDKRIGSLKAQVLFEEALKSPKTNIIRPNGTTIAPSPKSNTQRNLTKGEEVRTVQRVVVEIIQRQRDEIQELKKTSEYKELHQVLLNLHQDVMRRVEKSCTSGSLCSPAATTITRSLTSLEEEVENFKMPPSDSTSPDCRSGDRGDDDRPVMLNKKVAQGGYSHTLLRLGDKVAWKVRDQLQLGTVKWKGFVGSTIHVGIEFDKLIGLSWTEDNLDCLFKAKPGHGYLVPVDELVYTKAFVSMNNSKFKTDNNGIFNYLVKKIRRTN